MNSMKIVFIQVSLLVLIQMLISDIQSMNLRACKSSFVHQIHDQFRFQIVSTKNCAHLVWLLFLTWSQKSSSATFLSFIAWGNLVVSLALLALALPSQIPVDISTKAVCSAKGLTQPRWSIFNEKRSSPLCKSFKSLTMFENQSKSFSFQFCKQSELPLKNQLENAWIFAPTLNISIGLILPFGAFWRENSNSWKMLIFFPPLIDINLLFTKSFTYFDVFWVFGFIFSDSDLQYLAPKKGLVN